MGKNLPGTCSCCGRATSRKSNNRCVSCCQRLASLQRLGPPAPMNGVVVDECFRREVDARRWYLVGGSRGRPYLATKIDGRNIKMHHFIWNLSGRPLPEAPLTIDHANQNKLDNRLENLRVATTSLQAINRPSQSRGAGLPRGVFRQNNGTRPYQAQVSIGGKRVSLGYFATPKEASAAYEAKRDELLAIEVEKSLSLSSPE